VSTFAHQISINNVMVFEKTTEDIKNMFMRERKARFNYSDRISHKIDVSEHFYDEDAKDKTNKAEDEK
jgi:hypothetical protein